MKMNIKKKAMGGLLVLSALCLTVNLYPQAIKEKSESKSVGDHLEVNQSGQKGVEEANCLRQFASRNKLEGKCFLQGQEAIPAIVPVVWGGSA